MRFNFIVAAVSAAIFSVGALAGALRKHASEYIVVRYDRVYDGDTVVIRYPALPAPLDRLRVRIEKIDTPEYGKLARCEAEAAAATAARNYLVKLVGDAKELRVYVFKWDKYGGRILGDLHVDGGNVRDLMVQAGHAVPYDGAGPRKDWCAAK